MSKAGQQGGTTKGNISVYMYIDVYIYIYIYIYIHYVHIDIHTWYMCANE